MSELIFNYMSDSKPRHVAAFKYSYESSFEHSFAYKRYIALSDTSIFEGPVVITKVATGLSDLYNIFVEKNAHPVTFVSDLETYSKQKNVIDFRYKFCTVQHNTITSDYVISGEEISINHLGIYQHELHAQNIDHLKIYKNIHAKRYQLLDIYKDYFAKNFDYGYYEKINFAKRYQLLNINEDIIMKIPKTGFNILPMILARPPKTGFSILEDFMMETPYLAGNIYQHFIGERPIYIGNYYQQIAFNYPDNIGNYFDKIRMTRPTIMANIRKDYIFKRKDEIYNTHINDFFILKIRDFKGYKNKVINMKKRETGTLLHKNDIATSEQKIGNKNPLYIGTPYEKILNIEYQNLGAPSYNKTTNIFQTQFGIPDDKTGRISYDISQASTDKNKYTNIFKIYLGLPEEKIGHIEYNKLFGSMDIKESLINTTYQAKPTKMFGGYFNNDLHGKNNEKYSYVIKAKFAEKDLNNAWIEYYNLVANKINKESDLSKLLEIKDISFDKSNTYIQYSNAFINKLFQSTLDNKYLFAERKKDKAFLIYRNLFINGIIKRTTINYLDLWSKKEKQDLDYLSKQIFAYKIKNPMNIKKTELNILKSRIKMDIYSTSGINIQKIAKDIYFNEYNINGFKDKLDTNGTLLYKNIFASLEPKDISIANKFLFIEKMAYYIDIFKQSNSIYKLPKDIMEGEMLSSGLKDRLPIDYMTHMFEGYAGFLVPFSKVRRPMYIQKIDATVVKLHKNIVLDKQAFASVIQRPLGKPFLDLFCDKIKHEVYLDKLQTMAIKQKVKIEIWKDSVFAYRCSYRITLFDNIFVQKIKHPIWIDDEHVWAFRINKDLEIFKTEWFAYKISKEITKLDTVFIDKIPRLCYYEYDEFTWKTPRILELYEQQKQGTRTLYDMKVLDITQAFKNVEIYYDKILFSHKEISKIDFFQEVEYIHRQNNELNILPNDFGNWAWVYETPDPFDKDPYGIDELLLPENDTRYSDLEDLIFDKENMRPKSPIKILDTNKWVAKYPIKHPIPEYEDIGKYYTGIEFEQYYGVRTSIMHSIFLKFYRIWYSKIYEFSSMTMEQSVKKMLEYLYSWIVTYFPPDELQEAFRVFRLIRWYGETSIIQNSHYIVSYEYDTLYSKLNTGKCLIPSDLEPDINGIVQNDTMYVDANLSVIRNRPDFVGNTGAYVTFYVDVNKNTTITFSLANTVGSVNIYINGVIVDVISSTKLNLTYPIPYTGTVTEVKIEKTAPNNLNDKFFIGNIFIPDAYYKDLSIEFDPTLRAGNKPLNDIAQKMISVANLFDDTNEAYENIRKSNLGVSEMYKKLSEYWKYHHEDKNKGKRLTIKEV